MAPASPGSREWWKSAVIYQVYPRGYCDGSGDGVGDLAGLRRRLDHLSWLGVDAVWLSPIFESPMADFGYDISDYRRVDPLFGSNEELQGLLAEVHSRGMKLLLDLVPNHTSDRHPWFRESRKSRESPKRDWYLWRGEPNHWQSVFGGSAWERDAATGEHYYHAFLKEQPDLNWRNPEVERAMHEVVRFWLAQGVDGFRVDVIWHLLKDPGFRDNAPGTMDRQTDQPEVHPLIARLRRVVDEFPERVMIGEIYLPPEKLVAYYGSEEAPECLPFNFGLIHPRLRWEAGAVRERIERYLGALGKNHWPNWVLGNHDMPRIVSRVGAAQARVAAMLLLTLKGMPTIYQGDEIGLPDVPVPPDRVADPRERTQPGQGRDPERTPMQWDRSPHAGFCPEEADPWLPLSADWKERNVAVQREDPDSPLSLYRRLLTLRRQEAALARGEMELLPAPEGVIAYRREKAFLVALNLGGKAGELGEVEGRVELGTRRGREGEPVRGTLSLGPEEAVVVRLR